MPDTLPAATTQTQPGTCRFCGARDQRTYCGQCGGRVAGEPLETLSGCIVSRAQLKDLRARERLHDEDSDEFEAVHDAIDAALDLNQRMMQVADARRRGDPYEMEQALPRGDVEELLELLAPLPSIGDLRFNVWTLISDVERAVKEHRAREEYGRELERARKHTWNQKWKHAAEAWNTCLFWLHGNWHPEYAAVKSEAEAGLAHARGKLIEGVAAQPPKQGRAAPDAPLF